MRWNLLSRELAMSRKTLLILPLVLLCFLPSSSLPAFAAKHKKEKPPAATPQLTDERERAIHALNRLAFGPRPGDVDRVLAMSVDKWIVQQLEPEKIDD